MDSIFVEFSSLFSPDKRLAEEDQFSFLKLKIDQLASSPECGAALRRRILTKASSSSDRHLFVSVCLDLLHRLCDALIELRKQSDRKTRTTSQSISPSLPPDSLSISQQNLLGLTFQAIVALGIYPFLQQGVGQSIAVVCPISAHVVEKMIEDSAEEYCVSTLSRLISQLMLCQNHPSLKAILLNKHLGDLLCALIQICYGGCKARDHDCISDAQKTECKEILGKLLNNAYQPSVVRELLLLQGPRKPSAPRNASPKTVVESPTWLRTTCGMLLSQRLLHRNGLLSLSTALFDISQVSSSDASVKIPEMVASLATRLPRQASSRLGYFENMCSQVVELLSSQKSLTHGLRQTGASVLFSLCDKDKEAVGKFVVQPIKGCLANFLKRGVSVSDEVNDNEDVLRRINFLHRLFVLHGRSHDPVLTVFACTIPLLFRLASLCSQCHSRSLVMELLRWYFEAAEDVLSLRILCESLMPCSTLSSHYAQKRVGDLDHWCDVAVRNYEGELECLQGSVKNNETLADFLLLVLSEVTALLPCTEEESSVFILIGIASSLYETRGTAVLLNVEMLLERIESFIDVMIRGQHLKTKKGDIIKLPLGLLSGLLSSTEKDVRSSKRRSSIAELLGSVLNAHGNDYIGKVAENLRIALLVGSEAAMENLARQSLQKDVSRFQRAKDLLSDCLLPTQVQGINQMTKLIESEDKETLENLETVLNVFTDCINHADSYVYLAAINGLVALGRSRLNDVLPLLCKEFGSWEVAHPPEARAKVGEAITKLCSLCGDMLGKYREDLLAAFLSAARDDNELVRSSSLSGLATVCQLLRYSLGASVHEVTECLVAIGRSDSCPQVRQAAVFAIKSILKGLGNLTIEVAGDALLKLYRCLKEIESMDTDVTTQTHAQAALGELSTIMEQYLFPREKLTKKITVLDHGAL